MRGFLLLGIGAFATGAAVAVMQQRRAGEDDDYGEDSNWPSVPYTRETHPDSPQERVTAPVEQAPSEPVAQSTPDSASAVSSSVQAEEASGEPARSE